MSAEAHVKSAKAAKEEFDIISNRLAVALAKRESLIKSWTASSSRPQPPKKTQEELDAEDAALFRKEPAYLGVGATIPSHFLVSEAERNNKSLRAKFFPTKGLKASKARDAEEKAASAKRGMRDESSDEGEGRSGLGRAKKLKRKAIAPDPVKARDVGLEEEEEPHSGLGRSKKLKTETSAEKAVHNIASIRSVEEQQIQPGLGRSKKLKTKASAEKLERKLSTDVTTKEDNEAALSKLVLDKEGNLGRKESDKGDESDRVVTGTDQVVDTFSGSTGMDANEPERNRKREKKRKRKLRAETLMLRG